MPHSTRRPALVLLAALLLPAAAAGDELYQDFRGSRRPAAPLELFGQDPDPVVTPEEQGLRIKIPRDKAYQHRVGVQSTRPVRGDFEVTVGYELLHIDPAAAGHGVGLSVQVETAAPGGDTVELLRVLRDQEGETYGCVRIHAGDGRTNYDHQWVPTTAKAGALRLTRRGPDVTFAAREGPDGAFRPLHQVPFGDADVKAVKVAAFMGHAPNAVDLRLTDLRITAAAAAAAQADPPAPVNDAPAARTRGWLPAALVLVLGLLLAAVAAAYLVLRRRAAPAGTAVAFPCPGCGRKMKVRADQAGKAVKCPACGQPTRAPATASPEDAA